MLPTVLSIFSITSIKNTYILRKKLLVTFSFYDFHYQQACNQVLVLPNLPSRQVKHRHWTLTTFSAKVYLNFKESNIGPPWPFCPWCHPSCSCRGGWETAAVWPTTWVPDPAACGTAPWSNDHSHSCCHNKPHTPHFSDCIKITVTLAVKTNHTHPTSVTASRSPSLLLSKQTPHTPHFSDCIKITITLAVKTNHTHPTSVTASRSPSLLLSKQTPHTPLQWLHQDHRHSCCHNKPHTPHFSDCIKITVTLAVKTNHTHPTSVTASRSPSLLLSKQTTHTPLQWLHQDHRHSCCQNKPHTPHFSDCIKITVTLAVKTNHTHPTSVTASRSPSLLLSKQTTHTPLQWLHRPTALTPCCVLCTVWQSPLNKIHDILQSETEWGPECLCKTNKGVN